MALKPTIAKRRPLLGIYTPELQGFYFGELVGQLLTLCRIKNYRVSVIKTGDLGSFKTGIHTDAMDMVIILRNAVHPELAKKLLDEGKSVVSISYDYFPLNIPLITSDNEAGVELAISHLQKQGHENFLFVGNLKNYDVRKRYEAFSAQLEKHNLSAWEEEVFQLDDDLVSGGYQAADEFIRSQCTATAVICGTAVNSIGFSMRMASRKPGLKDLISLVAFDAISLIPVLEPNITTVDQNLNLVAHKALSVVDGSNNGEEGMHHYTVPPKLITAESDFMKSEEAYLATSCELAELYNANYMKSILCNITEWSRSIANAKLDNIMVLRTLFARFLSQATLSRVVTGKSGGSYIVYTKRIDAQAVEYLDVRNPASVSREHEFPKSLPGFEPDNYDTTIHVPRFVNGKLWGFISTWGKTESEETPSSYTGFTAFLDHVIEWMNRDVAPVAMDDTESVAGEDNIQEGCIRWNRETNELFWDSEALGILGFASELEQKIYGQMEMYDRLHEDDVEELRELLLGDKAADLPLEVRFKKKDRDYIACELYLNETDTDNDTLIKIRASLAGD